MSSAAAAASSSSASAPPATLDEDAALAHALAAEWALEDSAHAMEDIAPVVQPAPAAASQPMAVNGEADSSAADQAAYVLRCREDMLMHHLTRLTADGKVESKAMQEAKVQLTRVQTELEELRRNFCITLPPPTTRFDVLGIAAAERAAETEAELRRAELRTKTTQFRLNAKTARNEIEAGRPVERLFVQGKTKALQPAFEAWSATLRELHFSNCWTGHLPDFSSVPWVKVMTFGAATAKEAPPAVALEHCSHASNNHKQVNVVNGFWWPPNLETLHIVSGVYRLCSDRAVPVEFPSSLRRLQLGGSFDVMDYLSVYKKFPPNLVDLSIGVDDCDFRLPLSALPPTLKYLNLAYIPIGFQPPQGCTLNVCSGQSHRAPVPSEFAPTESQLGGYCVSCRFKHDKEQASKEEKTKPQ
jgi:hypothetical protein